MMELHIDDFTRKHYRELLELAASKYEFAFFHELAPGKKQIFWRHDVDFSIHTAAKLAHIEADLGLKSTYFILPHSDFYSILELEVYESLKEIKSLGHEIGIHFDSHFYQVSNEEELEASLNKEILLFKEILGFDVSAFSFHNTTEFTMASQKEKYAGLLNVYNAYLQKNVKYCSDSNGYWRFDRLADVLQSDDFDKLHVLTHPVWWQDSPMKPFDRILMSAEGRMRSAVENYEQTLAKYNRVNVK